MKKGWILAAGALVLAIIVYSSVKGSAPKGEKVYVEPVRRRSIESVVAAPGQVDPKVKVNISAHVVGKIEKLFFKEGDVVRRGQRLVEVERAQYTAQRDRVRAELNNRRIDVERARIGLQNAKVQLDRGKKMGEQGIQAVELLDRARLDYENSRTALLSAEEGVRQAQASVAQVAADLDRTTILSPIDGKVVQLNAQEGEVVVPGTMNNPGSVIAVIADLSSILVVADVGETEVVRVRQGQKVEVTIDAVAQKEYHGEVIEIGSSAGSRSGAGSGIRYFTVKAALGDPDERLRPGMTAQVEIITEAAPNVIAVPIQSVVERDPALVGKRKKKKKPAPTTGDESETKLRKYVFTAVSGKTKMIEVTTGISNSTHVAITSGLKGDEQVITGPFRILRKLDDGDAIRPEKEGDSAADDDDADEADEDDEKKE